MFTFAGDERMLSSIHKKYFDSHRAATRFAVRMVDRHGFVIVTSTSTNPMFQRRIMAVDPYVLIASIERLVFDHPLHGLHVEWVDTRTSIWARLVRRARAFVQSLGIQTSQVAA
jgi:hypothetical protein